MSLDNKNPSIVLDTNIFVSGLNYKGNERILFELFRKNKLKVVTSPAILEETAKVLAGKFNWHQRQIQEVIKEIQNKAKVVNPKEKLQIIKTKESDNRILECAAEGKASFVITGDTKHLLPLKTFRDIKIVSARKFLKSISGL